MPDIVTKTHGGGSLEELHRKGVRGWRLAEGRTGQLFRGGKGHSFCFNEVRQLMDHRVVMQVGKVGGRWGRPAWVADDTPNRFGLRGMPAISGCLSRRGA